MENYETLSSLIKICFVENGIDGSVVHPPIVVDKFKGTKIEYQDFFTQYTSESKEIMSTGLNNMLGNKE